MCKTAPCLGTPEDIIKLIAAGHGDKIFRTAWAAGVKYGIPIIEMYQIGYDHQRGCCPFLQNGLCSLHECGLKPTEGRLADCKVKTCPDDKQPPYLLVAHTWSLEHNASTIATIKSYVFRKLIRDSFQLTEI